MIKAVDMTFDLAILRNGNYTTIATWQKHFAPKPGADFTATLYELDQPASETLFEPGDQLIFRYTAANTTSAQAWIPNGDGAKGGPGARVPSFTLPK